MRTSAYGIKSCIPKKRNSAKASILSSLRFRNTATANADCAAVKKISCCCLPSSGKPLKKDQFPEPTAQAIGRVPMSKVH